MVNRLENYAAMGAAVYSPPVTEKAFDEYHLYTLERRTTLRDRETKQVEFIRAAGVTTKQVYIYDGVKIDPNRYNGWAWENIRNDHSYGTESNPKIWVMREFRNSDANHLGMPLPKGRVRFYRRSERSGSGAYVKDMVAVQDAGKRNVARCEQAAPAAHALVIGGAIVETNNQDGVEGCVEDAAQGRFAGGKPAGGLFAFA